MTRSYDNIPRQGEHPGKPFEAEPTTNVRAQDPAHPPDRSKSTGTAHVLLRNPTTGAYRLRTVPAGAAADGDGFEEVDRVPQAGDVDRLLGQLPDRARYAVFEHAGSGAVELRENARPEGDWTHDEIFDRVTIFEQAEDARAFADERRASAE